MSNPGNNRSIPHKAIEIGASLAGPLLGSTAALHELDASNWISAPWVQEIPGAEQSSSMVASFAVGIVATVAAERLATRLDTHGKERTAENIRRAGKVAAWTGSLACQLVIETNPRGGVSDKWDLMAGLAATAPGIIAGRFISRSRRTRTNSNTHTN